MNSSVRSSLRNHLEETIRLSDTDFSNISNLFENDTISKNQTIISKGEPVNYIFWVVSGCLKASVKDESHREHILQLAIEHCWITDYPAFLNQQPATVNITSLNDTELLFLSFENRQKICRKFKNMEYFFSRKFDFNYLWMQQRILSLTGHSPEEKYRYLLDKYPDFIQRIPEKLLALFLGINIENLFRLKCPGNHIPAYVL